ncbi:MAG TPA: lytic transglycosylase domain-containing protein [Thermoanaerobaculia bacterium]|nr:lytic transglycosylase domain-containing protein [Thermoanaerobaculia bacterium]
MAQIQPSRPFQQRFLNGYDRSQLRQEVQKVPPRRFAGLRKRVTPWAIGASIALGGVGLPMKMTQQYWGQKGKSESRQSAMTEEPSIDTAIAGDLEKAQNIAAAVAGGLQAVAGGVQAAAGTVAETATPVKAAAEAPRKLAVVSENTKEQFFKKEIPFGSLIYHEAKKNNLRPELVAAVVHTESKFKPNARSHAGAQGLMQLVPRTGRWMGAKNLMNPVENIAAGTKYLKYLNERFDGNEQKVIAAYNAGEGNVRRFGGIPPFKETRQYVQRVKSFEAELGDRINGQITTQIAMAR